MHVTLLTGIAVLTVAACGPNAMPPPSPNEFLDVVSALVLRGATITNQVAGDAGCTQPPLHDNAVRLDVAMPGAPPAGVYLFRWRRAGDFDAEADAYAACVAEAEARDPDATVTSEERLPWRGYGAGWSPALRDAVEEALTSP